MRSTIFLFLVFFFSINIHLSGQLLDGKVFEPVDTTHAPIYEKVELGLNLPTLDSVINTFLNDNTGQYKPGTSNYAASLTNGIIINPYDPESISINAYFIKPNGDTVLRYGFYYNEYDRNGLTPPNDDWFEISPGTDLYEWRIRFAPDQLGLWSGYIKVEINAVEQPGIYAFHFQVTPSNNPGFVSVASNHQYLKFSNGTQFFPVGCNYAWRWNHGSCADVFDPYNSCGTINCSNPDDQRLLPNNHQLEVKYIDRLTDTDPGGVGSAGNHSRLILSPTEYEFEWERLGNYHSRQVEMFELDEYLKYCELRNVYLSICPFVAGEGIDCTYQIPLYNYCGGWQWNPYNNLNSGPNAQHNGIAGVYTYVDYYTNPVARKFTRNKLRYLLSRWGYSTHFMVNEISTELGGIGFDTIFFNNQIYEDLTEDWVGEMANYSKNVLKCHQLNTASYLHYNVAPAYRNSFVIDDDVADGPNHIISHLWDKESIDIASGHFYNNRIDQLGLRNDQMQQALQRIKKPCIYNEHDQQDAETITTCTSKSLHNQLWSSALSGSYGPGLAWEWKRYLIDDWFNSPQGDFAPEYRIVREFISYMDLLIPEGYESIHDMKGNVHPWPNDSPFENFYLVKSGGNSNKLYGWFYNRSFNEYTNPGNCSFESDGIYDCYHPSVGSTIEEVVSVNPTLLDAYFNPWFTRHYFDHFPLPYKEYPLSTSTFKLTGLSPSTLYEIEYFYTSGPAAGIFEATFSNIFATDLNGSVMISNGPPTGNGFPGDWAYIVHRLDEPVTQSPTNNNNKWYSEQNIINYKVTPNPNGGEFSITFQSNFSLSTILYIYDILGKQMYSRPVNISLGNNNIDFIEEGIAAGLYYVSIRGIRDTFKVVITR